MSRPEPRLLRRRGRWRWSASAWRRKWLLVNPAAPERLVDVLPLRRDRRRSRRSPSSSSPSTTPSTSTARCSEIAEASQTGPATNIIAGIAVGLECTLRCPSSRSRPRSSPRTSSARAALAGRRPLRHRRRHDGHARHGGLHPGDGHLRPDHRQRRRHRRDVAAARGDPQEDRPPRRRRQHDQGAHQGLRHRLGRARRLPALLGLPRRGRRTTAPSSTVASTSPSPRSSSAACSARCSSSSSPALAIQAVGKAAHVVIEDVRAQFKEQPGHHAGHGEARLRPHCVDIVTRGALRQMVAPGLVAVGTPIVGRASSSSRRSAIGAEAVAALLMVGTIAGILMALFLNNGGGAWDNAKKYIETGAYGGKGSPDAQGGGRRRHGRRSVQGHRRPVAARADQAARDDHAGAGAAVHLTGRALAALPSGQAQCSVSSLARRQAACDSPGRWLKGRR